MRKSRSISTLGIVCILLLTLSQASGQGFNDTATSKSIAAKAVRAPGPAVNISTNYWLAWTGAWDTVIIKETKLWEKWLPAGSTVEWKRNLQGPPVITDLLADKQQIGYIGDNPALVATTKRDIAELNIVAVNETSPGRMCGLLVVRKDAPAFANQRDAIKWLNGKVVGVPKGSCADRLGQVMLKKEGVSVTWQQMQPEVIVTSLQASKIDAAVLYEPHASKAVFDGFGRYAASPAAYGEIDADAVVMRKDWVEKNRPVAVAWLKANIEALYFMRDNPMQTIELVKKELPDYTRENLWFALYGKLPAEAGGSDIALRGTMAITPEVQALLTRGYAFLREIKVAQEPALHANAVRSDLVNQAFTELGLDPTKALFEIAAAAPGQNPYKGDQLIKK